MASDPILEQRVAKLEAAFVDIQDDLRTIKEQQCEVLSLHRSIQDLQKKVVMALDNQKGIKGDVATIMHKMDGIEAAVKLLPALLRTKAVE